MTKREIAIIALAALSMLAAGLLHAQNRALSARADLLDERVRQLTDARAADSAAMAERGRMLRETTNDLRTKEKAIFDALDHGSDRDLLDALRSVHPRRGQQRKAREAPRIPAPGLPAP